MCAILSGWFALELMALFSSVCTAAVQSSCWSNVCRRGCRYMNGLWAPLHEHLSMRALRTSLWGSLWGSFRLEWCSTTSSRETLNPNSMCITCTAHRPVIFLLSFFNAVYVTPFMCNECEPFTLWTSLLAFRLYGTRATHNKPLNAAHR